METNYLKMLIDFLKDKNFQPNLDEINQGKPGKWRVQNF